MSVIPLFKHLTDVQKFELDLLALFTFQRQGHMEQWEYWEASFPGDPAGGAQFWESLVHQPGPYYLPGADRAMLARAVHHSGVNTVLKDINTVVELGPGSPDSIAGKTIPFLSHAKNYIAVDHSVAQADHAAHQVNKALGIPTSALIDDYLHPTIPMQGRPKTGFIMWGGSIGNIAGLAGENAQPKLVKSLASLADCCNAGDSIFVGIDTETRREWLMNAYNTPVLSQKFLSVLFAAKKFGLPQGHFTPETWTHRSVWHEISGQCAHYLIAGEDQDFILGGKRIKIPAGKAVITNNSYKFSRPIVEEAARRAGFSRVYITHDSPIALLMATK